MVTEQISLTDRVLVYDVHTSMSDNYLRKELFKTYRGIRRVQRLYHQDEYKTPKDLVQIDFTSPKHADTVLENGFLTIGQLRCHVKALKSSILLQKQLNSDNGSDYRSDIFAEEEQVTDKILLHDVPVEITENDLAQQLSKTYRGVKHVKRWYNQDESKGPTERVQIDFQSPKDTEAMLEGGFIEIGEFCFPATYLKPSRRLQKHLESDYGSESQSEISFGEEPITNQILVCNIPTEIDVNYLQKSLLTTYSGITQISRWCFDDDCQFPMVCVQIDFIAPRYAKAILSDGFIVDRKTRYQVKPLKLSAYKRNALESDTESDYQSQVFSE